MNLNPGMDKITDPGVLLDAVERDAREAIAKGGGELALLLRFGAYRLGPGQPAVLILGRVTGEPEAELDVDERRQLAGAMRAAAAALELPDAGGEASS